ncbi:MAG: hypothetical protein J1E83_05680 [Lachnospiraceae bacterium]|nr:hypothetical protein [Lachnospiraceae bacterium]
MDITPIYDLRARLRAAMIAGTNLLSEDFRLKRAVEAVTPLEQASPVFARIGQLSKALLNPAQEDKEGALLDTITLVDAVLCTQGAVAAGGQGTETEITKLPGSGCGNVVTNAPYSVVSALTEALTSSGSGHFSFVSETHENQPELFSDYRIKAALVQALGAGYSELADLAETWLKEEDASLLPLLQNQFDPEGKKEMVRRVRVMEAIAPKEANAFFVEKLPDAKKEVRQALIFALRHCPENEELLWNLTKAEKGNSRQAAYRALTHMESSEAERFCSELCRENALEVMQLLSHTERDWAARLVAKELKSQLQSFVEKEYFLTNEQALLLQTTLQAVVGKTGPEIIDALRETIRLEKRLNNKENNPFVGKKENWTFSQRYSGGTLSNKQGSFQDMLIHIIHRTLIRTADVEMAGFVMEVCEEKQRKKEDWEAYFPVAAVAHLLVDEDCSGWLSKQLLGLVRPTKLYASLYWAWGSISWNEIRQAFILQDIALYFDLLDGYQTSYVHTLKQDMAGGIADVLMRCHDAKLDQLLIKYVSRENEAYRTRLEEYYYKRALAESDNRSYLRMLKSLGSQRCEGLAVQYFKGRTGKISLWEIKQFESYCLPGDAKAKYEELLKVYDLIKRGRIQLQKGPGSTEEDILAYLEGLKC